MSNLHVQSGRPDLRWRGGSRDAAARATHPHPRTTAASVSSCQQRTPSLNLHAESNFSGSQKSPRVLNDSSSLSVVALALMPPPDFPSFLAGVNNYAIRLEVSSQSTRHACSMSPKANT